MSHTLLEPAVELISEPAASQVPIELPFTPAPGSAALFTCTRSQGGLVVPRVVGR
jgi:hypothetical protein